MVYYDKVGLLLLSKDGAKFLVCNKHDLADYIMPGGQIEDGETVEQDEFLQVEEQVACLSGIEKLEAFLDDFAGIVKRDLGRHDKGEAFFLHGFLPDLFIPYCIGLLLK